MVEFHWVLVFVVKKKLKKKLVMAEVLGKANLFTTCNYGQKKNQEGGISLFSKRISGFCLKKNSFPTLKVKSQALGSDFNGQRVVFLEKKSVNNRRFCQVPITAQVGLINFIFLFNFWIFLF